MSVSLKQMTLGVVILSVCMMCGCGEKTRGDRVATWPVTGEVYVDGQPVEGLHVICNNVQGVSREVPLKPKAFTGPGGKFSLATYESGDGVPKGEYTLTFMWGKFSQFSGYIGPDKLNNRYADPKTSKFPVKMEDKAVDLGKIQLTTK